jgi:endoglucanase
LWLGESGENSNTWFTNTIQLMEDNDIGWCWWQLKKMGINNPLEIKEPKNYDLFVKYCKGEIAKPNKKVSAEILNSLLENIKIENNIYHKDVTDAMFRQIHSTETLPFTSNIISEKNSIKAVDFDFGRNGFAYNDTDTASYMYTPGVHTQGNRGRTYRNDGVDIKSDKSGDPFVFNIENDEWLLYTFDVEKSGNYNLSFTTSGPSGIINIFKNGQLVSEKFNLPASTDSTTWKTSPPKNIYLGKGKNTIKTYFVKGGFNLKNVQLELKDAD